MPIWPTGCNLLAPGEEMTTGFGISLAGFKLQFSPPLTGEAGDWTGRVMRWLGTWALEVEGSGVESWLHHSRSV